MWYTNITMKKTIKIKDINYCKNDLNKLCDKHCHDNVIRLTEKDTVAYRFVKRVMDNCITATLAAVIFSGGFYLGSKLERNSFEKRAIEAGVGEYIIVDPYTGETGFDFVNPTEISRAFGMIQ